MGLSFALVQIGYIAFSVFGLASIVRLRGNSPIWALSFAITIMAVIPFLILAIHWTILPSSWFANFLRWIFVVLCISAGVLGVSRHLYRDEIIIPIALLFLSAVLVTVWVYGVGRPDALLRAAGARWTFALPIDNVLPLDLAQQFAKGSITKGLQPGDWLSSDRPPLQAAMYLATPGSLIFGPRELSYQPAGVTFQLFSLIGVWIVVRALGVGVGVSIGIVAAALFTPITLINSGFVWPKLLAASFLFPLAVLHFTDAGQRARTMVWGGVFAGALCALSLLSHGTAAFTILGMGVAALITRRFGSVRYLAGAMAGLLLLYLPWVAYQKFVDPPGNRLIKWHLAQAVAVDDRGLIETIADSYRGMSAHQIVDQKIANLRMLEWRPLPWVETFASLKNVAAGDMAEAHRRLKLVRDTQAWLLPEGTGFLLILFPLAFLWKRTRTLAFIVLTTTIVWAALMFAVQSMTVLTGSMFTPLTVIALTCAALNFIRPWLAYAAIVVHVLVTTYQFML